MVGLCERVSDSVQPVHSWKESQITEGRRALPRAAAIFSAASAGSAIMVASPAQNLRNSRRPIPCRRSSAAILARSRLLSCCPPAMTISVVRNMTKLCVAEIAGVLRPVKPPAICGPGEKSP